MAEKSTKIAVGKSASDRRSTAPHGSAKWPVKAWSLMLVASVILLLLPAFYNGFPLIFPDTGAYLSVAYAHTWTVDRSPFYGLLYKPILSGSDPVGGLWMALVLQITLVCAVLLLAVRRAVPDISPLSTFALIVSIAVLTALPWHAAQLMPDAFTGPLVLLVWLAMLRDPAASGVPLLWLGVVFLGLMHYTHIGLIAVVAVASSVVFATLKMPFVQVGKRLLAAAITIGLLVAGHIVPNGIRFDRWSVSPMGSLFLFARVYEDGLAPRWLERHCGRDAPQPLCAIRHSLPVDSQVLLWGGPASPLNAVINEKVEDKESWKWIDMLHQVAIGSIREEPFTFAANSVRSTARQFIHFEALDDECPKCTVPDLIEMRPALGPKLRASRQLRDEIPKKPIRMVTNFIAGLALLSLLPLMEVARRKRDALALSLLASILGALIANAFMAGALSDVHDRYQSRVIWLVPLTVLLVAMRWDWLRTRFASRLVRPTTIAVPEITTRSSSTPLTPV